MCSVNCVGSKMMQILVKWEIQWMVDFWRQGMASVVCDGVGTTVVLALRSL